MPDEKKEAKAKREGFDGPIANPGDPSKLPAHIHPDTLMIKGIAPDSKERVAINLDALKYEFGDKKGFAKYVQIAKAGGFLDPSQSADQFYPDLSLEGLKSTVKQEIESILRQE